MHWLALHCSGLPLEVFSGIPVAVSAVIETSGGRECVVAAGSALLAAGIAPGMSIDAARARRPDLQVLMRDRAAEGAALERLAGDGLSLTDHVAPEPPQGLLLEVGRSLHLFGGIDRLLADVDGLLARRGHEAVQGVAPTPAAARLLAHAGGGRIDAEDGDLPTALADLPAGLIAPDADTRRRLTGWGVTRVGECLALPRAGLARRLGQAFVDALDRVTGRQTETVPRFVPPTCFRARLALPQTTRTLALVLTAVDLLIRDLAVWLRSRDMAVQGFRVGLHDERNATTDVDVGLAVPGREHTHLLTLARERLERVGLNGAVAAVSLTSEAPTAYAPPPTDLWHEADGEPPERLLERLRARLGREAVEGLALRADHRPEYAWAVAEPGRTPAYEPRHAPTRPLWLLSRPAALRTDAAGQPRLAGPLEWLAGPERIETGWWDGHDVARDYYVTRSRVGLVLWIYRERLAPRGWYVHGLFG